MVGRALSAQAYESSQSRLRRAYGAAALAIVFVSWFLVTDVLGLVGQDFVPAPLDVLDRFVVLFTEPFSGTTLVGHALSSLNRWGLGLLMSVAIGITFGVLLAWIPVIRAGVTPVFEFLRYIPPFAWIPIAVLWFGASTSAQAMVVFIAAFPACVINSQLGVSKTDPLLLKAAQSLGAGSLRTLWKVVLPLAMPEIFTGVRIAFSNGWMALVGAELVVGKEGLGYLISQGQQNGSTTTIFVGIISIGVIGSLFDVLMQRAQKLLIPWRSGMTEGK